MLIFSSKPTELYVFQKTVTSFVSLPSVASSSRAAIALPEYVPSSLIPSASSTRRTAFMPSSVNQA